MNKKKYVFDLYLQITSNRTKSPVGEYQLAIALKAPTDEKERSAVRFSDWSLSIGFRDVQTRGTCKAVHTDTFGNVANTLFSPNFVRQFPLRFTKHIHFN